MVNINTLRNEMRSELENNILPFWMNKMEDNEQGGFYGEITGNDELRPEAPKGAILNARILWTFSAAYRLLKKPEYLATATRAKRYLIDCFYDPQYGGIYWNTAASTGRSTAKAIRLIRKNKSTPSDSPSTD